MPRETMTEKAQRLLDEGRVTLLERPGTFAVVGETRSYLTVVSIKELADARGVPWSSCTCEARGACYHLLACIAIRRILDAGGVWPPPAEEG